MAEPRKKLDLRGRPPTPPPAARPAARLESAEDALGPGLFRPGQVLDPAHMTAYERQQLAAIGWDPGTPVPGNAAELIRAAQQEAQAEGVLPVPADTPPLTMPPTVDISRLPQAKQRELREALVQAGRYQQQYAEHEAATAGLDPGIAEAVRVAEDAAQSGRPPRGIAVVDDRPFRRPKAAAAAPVQAPPAPPRPRPKPTGWPQPEPAQPPPEPEPEPEPEPAPQATNWRRPGVEPFLPPGAAPPPPDPTPPIGDLSSTGAIGITHCPHCSWDLKRPDPSDPSDDDKRNYLMATLGGPGHRFTRDTSLLGGVIRVGYRELTGGEADAALTQIADDVRKNRVVGDGEWWQKLMDYRMVQALEYIEIQQVGRVYEGLDLDEIETDDGNPTPFPALVSYLLANVLHSESIRRAVGQGYARFQRLCEKLEANADSASFWDGIGSLR
jgi:hypothetical protein